MEKVKTLLKNKKGIAFLFALVALVVGYVQGGDISLNQAQDVYVSYQEYQDEKEKSDRVTNSSDIDASADARAEDSVTLVTFVVDGDTFELQDGSRVRMVGIDTPEIGADFYKEATNKLSEYILNKEVTLRVDTTNTDRYDRLLRYVYVDDIFVNEEMVRSGFARAKDYKPDTAMSDVLFAAQKEAQNERLNIWSSAESRR